MTYRGNRSSRGSRNGSADTLALGLGGFSIAIGLAEVMAPRRLTRWLGMPGHESLVQAYGMREIANGIGILTARERAPWMWGRVGGDALDIATLATGLERRNPKRENVVMALAAVAGVTLLDAICAQSLNTQSKTKRLPMRDYRRRSGFPRSPAEMRGAAKDFKAPADMRTPDALRPYPSGGPREKLSVARGSAAR